VHLNHLLERMPNEIGETVGPVGVILTAPNVTVCKSEQTSKAQATRARSEIALEKRTRTPES
jgi:hypothetical protein